MAYTEIDAKEAFETLDRHHVIDVREEYEFRGPLGCIAGADLIPLAQLEDHVWTLDRHRPLLLVCRSGKRSGRACEQLAALGFDDLTNLAGGMIGWNLAGLPVVHREPENLTALVDQVVAWTAQVGPLTVDAAFDIVRDRFERQHVTYESPSHGAVEELISFVGESLAPVNPPDLDLSLASFRRSLAVL